MYFPAVLMPTRKVRAVSVRPNGKGSAYIFYDTFKSDTRLETIIAAVQNRVVSGRVIQKMKITDQGG